MMLIQRIVLILLLVSVRVFAQQDPQFTQYMFNQLYFNPAHAGIEGITRFSALHRTQWLGYQPTFDNGGAPATQLVTFSSPLYKLNSGIGAYISNDRVGPLNNVEIQFSYAYHKAIGSGKLSAGIRTGIYSQTVNFDRYRPVSPDDPLINSKGKASQGRPDLALGINYRTEKFYLGVSSVHLLPTSFDFGLNQNSRLKPHYYLSGGFFHEINFDLKFQLMTLIKSDFAKTAIDFGGLAYFKDTMWAGLSFRESEAAILLLGYSLMRDKSLKIGYALDYIVNDQAVKQPTSHEIMLSYDLPVATALKKKVVRTPRYRH
jgi:type IX secretion system PorP/SprF family membrane protein